MVLIKTQEGNIINPATINFIGFYNASKGIYRVKAMFNGDNNDSAVLYTCESEKEAKEIINKIYLGLRQNSSINLMEEQ